MRGLRGKVRFELVPLLAACHALEAPPDLWAEAGDLGYYLARRGRSARTLDLLIAVHSLAHSVPLLTRDSGFRAMLEAGVPLTLVN